MFYQVHVFIFNQKLKFDLSCQIRNWQSQDLLLQLSHFTVALGFIQLIQFNLIKLGDRPFNHSHCRFLPGELHLMTLWHLKHTFLSQRCYTVTPPTPPCAPANPCWGGILSQYFSPTDILLERFGGKIWKRHSEGGDKWQVIHIKGLKQNRYFLPSRWSLIKTLEIPKEILTGCRPEFCTSSWCFASMFVFLHFTQIESRCCHGSWNHADCSLRNLSRTEKRELEWQQVCLFVRKRQKEYICQHRSLFAGNKIERKIANNIFLPTWISYSIFVHQCHLIFRLIIPLRSRDSLKARLHCNN